MSKPSKTIKLVIKDGTITGIYDDALVSLMAEGEVTIKRASHVEPYTVGPELDRLTGWSADLRPVGGPILANFKTRAEALAAEVDYLNEHVIT